MRHAPNAVTLTRARNALRCKRPTSLDGSCAAVSIDELFANCEIPHSSRPIPELSYRAWAGDEPPILEITDKRRECDGRKQVRAKGSRRRSRLHDRRKPRYSRTGVHSRGLPEKVQAQRSPVGRHRSWTNGVRRSDPHHRYRRRTLWFLSAVHRRGP